MSEFIKSNNLTADKDKSLEDAFSNTSSLYNVSYSAPTIHYYAYDASKGEHNTVSLNKTSPDDQNIASFSSTGIERIQSFDISGNDLTINYGGFYYPNANASGQPVANEGGSVNAYLQDNSVTIKNFLSGDGFDLYRYNDGISSYTGDELLSATPYAVLNFTGKQSNLVKVAQNNVVTGDSSDSWLFGDNNNDIITGGSGNETIFTGVYGNNTVVSGAGDDVMIVGANSSNRFVFSKGDGNDTIVNAGASWGRNIIDFSDISSSDIVSVKQTSEDADKGYSALKRDTLTIQYSDKDSVTITNNSWQPIEDLFTFKFSDNQILTENQLLDLFHSNDGTSTNSQITPSSFSDTQQIKGAVLSDFYKANSGVKDPSIIKDTNTLSNIRQEQHTFDYQAPLLTEHTVLSQNNVAVMNVQ